MSNGDSHDAGADLCPNTSGDLSEAMRALRARTPARLLVGRAGNSYRTATQLELREDHAAAVDAVRAELDLARDFGREFIDAHRLFEVNTRAASKSQYLLRPDLGRQLDEAARHEILRRCLREVDLQVAIGDGLSAAAAATQVPTLLPLLAAAAKEPGWTFGQPLVVRYCRVGVLNDLGDLLAPRIAVLLIGERPGLVTAESLSAYMAYQPRAGQTDAQRNLISNIHGRGVDAHQAASRIVALAEQMLRKQTSGVAIKEELPQARVASFDDERRLVDAKHRGLRRDPGSDKQTGGGSA